MHHELRHIFLGNFGRSLGKAAHAPLGQADNDVDRQTKAAEEEAERNKLGKKRN
jgi:hypothetical protein